MRYLTPALVIAAALTLSAPTAHAIPMTFVGNLSGANEVPPTTSTGTGLATIVLDPTAQTITFNVTFSGLTPNDTAAHIHCCAPLGTNVGVATAVPALPGFPLGVTSGTFINQTFDLTQASFYNPAFITLEGSTSQAETALIAGIEDGMTYFNIHTVNNPGGEIRSQLFPAPEPASIVLLGSAVLGFGLIRRRKSAAQSC